MTNRMKDVFPDWFQRTTAGVAAMEEANQADRMEMERLQDQLAALYKERDETLPRLAAESRAATAEVPKARLALAEAQKRAGLAIAASAGASSLFDSREIRIRGEIRALADNEAIDAFISARHRELAELRRSVKTIDAEFMTPRGEMLYLSATNAKSVGRRCVAITRAIREADELRYRAVDDVQASLDAIYRGLPAVEAPQEPKPPKKSPNEKYDLRTRNALRRGIITEADLVSEEVA